VTHGRAKAIPLLFLFALTASAVLLEHLRYAVVE
jgi:hypothetical protein